MEKGQESDKKLTLEDLPHIQEQTLQLKNLLLDGESATVIHETDWPLRYLWTVEEIPLEVIFSQMGSVTFIPRIQNLPFRPSPIFYLSLSKGEQFVWENIHREEVEISKQKLKSDIQKAAQTYLDSLPPL